MVLCESHIWMWCKLTVRWMWILYLSLYLITIQIFSFFSWGTGAQFRPWLLQFCFPIGFCLVLCSSCPWFTGFVHPRGQYESNASFYLFFFSPPQTVTSVMMKCTHIMGTSFTKLRLFFHKVSFIINKLFSPLLETLNWLRKTCSWSVRALYTCCILSLCHPTRWHRWSPSFRGPKKMEVSVC